MPPLADPRAASSSSISPSPPSDGGEGWGEEVRFYWFPLSSVLSPLVPRGERMESLMHPREIGDGVIAACVRAAMIPCCPLDGDATQRIPATLADHDVER